MPGVVQQWVEEVRQEKEVWAHEDLLDRLEQRYAPAEYETTGLSENQLEARDRLYEGDWKVAQRAAARELTTLVAANPGKSYVELLDQYDRKQIEQTQRLKPANELTNQEIVAEAQQQEIKTARTPAVGIPVLYISERAMYDARNIAIEHMTAERDRMEAIRKAADAGELAPRDIPPDAYTYYGRARRANDEISVLHAEQHKYERAEYDRAMAEMRRVGAAEQRHRMAGYEPQKTLAALETIGHREQGRIALVSRAAGDVQRSEWLSSDDQVHAYRQGANAELSKWYWERKRENGFGKDFFKRENDMDPNHQLKPATQLSNQEIVAEARELHSHFKHLSEQYSEAAAEQRPQLREEMAPLVDRERALRQEYTGRATQELSIDRSPAEISYAR